MDLILNDFKSITKVSYDVYIESKSFPLYEIKNINGNGIKKISNSLYINSKQFDLELMSINDVFSLLLNEIQGLEIYIYEENPGDFLANSALFLCDFNTTKIEEINITKTSTNINNFNTIEDKYLNSFNLVDINVYDSFKNKLDFKLEDGYIQSNFIDYGKLYLTYKANNYKGRALEEFPITHLNQLTLTKEGI